MRYNSNSDRTLLTRQSLGPVAAIARRRYGLPIPGRGTQGFAARSALRGFGAVPSSFGPPTGQGAGGGAATGASQGAAIGSAIVPGIGTAIGAVVGAIGGAIAGSLGKKDPENYNFDQAVALWQQQPDAVYSIGNKYLPLAGLFDLNIKTNIPIYKKFGHMGEQAFVNALVQQLYAAVQTGRVGPADSAITVFNNIIQPWINGFGYGAMSDPHADLINRLIIGMINDWFTGAWRNEWYAVGGDFPFGNLPSFPGFASSSPAPTAQPAPGTTPTASATPSPKVLPSTNPLQHDTDAYFITPFGTFFSYSGGSFNYAPPNSVMQTQFALTPAHTGGYGTVSIAYTGGQVVATDSNGALSYFNPGTQTFGPIPYQAPAASTSNTPAAPAALTPPAIGANIQNAPDSVTGQNTGLPSGATFGGLTPEGAWIIVYPSGVNAGQYTLKSGTLTPYSPVTTTPATTGQTSPPSGYTNTGQTATISGQSYPLYSDPAGNTYLWTGTQMVPYQSAPAQTTSIGGGGGGGYYTGGGGYNAPSTPAMTPQVTDASLAPSGSSPWLWLALAAGAAYVLME